MQDQDFERKYDVIQLDKMTADSLVKTWLPGSAVESIQRFTGGRSTTNYQITLANNKKKVILRIYPDAGESLRKEYAVYQLLYKQVPMPEIYYINEEYNLCEHPFAIMEFLEGVTLDKYIAEQNGLNIILARQIGETLALIHKKEYPKEGFLDKNLLLTDGLPPILQWYDYFLAGRCGKRLGEKLTIEIRDSLAGNTELLKCMTERFVLSHGDFRPENIMVKDGKLAGIIDWEGALSAPDYFDLGQFIRYGSLMGSECIQSLIFGYNSVVNHPVGDDWLKLSKLIDLANLFSILDSEAEKPILHGELKALVEKTLTI